MCGIVCAFDIKESSEKLRPQILEMSKSIRHRGPDWSGIHSDEKAILSHERLAIVDLASGKQPLYSKDGKIVLAQTPEDLHKNHNGDMHAAVMFSVLEMAGMGVLTLFLGDQASKAFVVLKDLHIFYDARAQGRITFTAELTEEQKIKLHQAFDQGEAIEELLTAYAHDEQGKQVSHATMTGVIRSKV